MSTFTSRFVNTTLLLAATGGLTALAIKITALLLQALVLPMLLATALGILGWIGYHLVISFLASLQATGEPSVVEPTATELQTDPEVIPDSEMEEAQQPPQVEMIEEPQPEIDLQPMEVYEQLIDQLRSEAGTDLPTETESQPEGEQQPQAQPEPETTTHHEAGEEETLAPATVDESDVEPTSEMSEEQPEEQLGAIPTEGTDTGGTLEAEEILSEEDIKAKVESGELTFTKMKKLCRTLNLDGYGKIRNCTGYVSFLAQQNLRRSQLDQAA
jgi:hypothetical protein